MYINLLYTHRLLIILTLDLYTMLDSKNYKIGAILTEGLIDKNEFLSNN